MIKAQCNNRENRELNQTTLSETRGRFIQRREVDVQFVVVRWVNRCVSTNRLQANAARLDNAVLYIARPCAPRMRSPFFFQEASKCFGFVALLRCPHAWLHRLSLSYLVGGFWQGLSVCQKHLNWCFILNIWRSVHFFLLSSSGHRRGGWEFKKGAPA